MYACCAREDRRIHPHCCTCEHVVLYCVLAKEHTRTCISSTITTHHGVSSQDLEDRLKAAEDKKRTLEMQAQACAVKLDRARALIRGLGGERERWDLAMTRLQVRRGEGVEPLPCFVCSCVSKLSMGLSLKENRTQTQPDICACTMCFSNKRTRVGN